MDIIRQRGEYRESAVLKLQSSMELSSGAEQKHVFIRSLSCFSRVIGFILSYFNRGSRYERKAGEW